MKRFIAAPVLFVIPVLFMFSNVQAQSYTVTGVVYENSQAKVNFKTPKGRVVVILPDDIRPGETITGTVSAEPAGVNTKEQKKNVTALMKYKLYLPDGSPLALITSNPPVLSNGQVTSGINPFTVNPGNSFSLSIKDGNNIISKADIPVMPSMPSGGSNNFTLTKKIITNNEPLVLLCPSATSSPVVTIKNYFQSPASPAKSYALDIIARSPRQLVCRVPDNVSGSFKVCVQTPGGPNKLIDLVNIVDIKASIGKSNLLRDEKTEFHVQVSGLEGCPYRPVKLEISNKTPAIIQLDNGNQQLIPVDQASNAMASVTHQPYITVQGVTGQSTGGFVINNILHVPVSAYANPIAPYLAEIKDATQMKSTVEVLQQVIGHFISNPKNPKILTDYLQQVKNNLPANINANTLDQSKALVTNLLNPVGTMNEGTSFSKELNILNELFPSIASQANVPQLVHPLHDLAGEFNTKTNVLKVSGANKDALLQYLGAKKMSNGNYSFQLKGNGNQLVTYNNTKLIDVDPNDPNSPADPDPGPVVTSGVSDNPPPKDTIKKETPWRDTTRPELTSAFKDTSGRRYRFYKDAKCEEMFPGRKMDCAPEDDYIPDPAKPGETKWGPTGKYCKWEHQSYKMCKKGDGFCTEMWQVTAVEMIYEDKNCQRLLSVKTFEHFMCQ